MTPLLESFDMSKLYSRLLALEIHFDLLNLVGILSIKPTADPELLFCPLPRVPVAKSLGPGSEPTADTRKV
jgi:hypothetical protein